MQTKLFNKITCWMFGHYWRDIMGCPTGRLHKICTRCQVDYIKENGKWVGY